MWKYLDGDAKLNKYLRLTNSRNIEALSIEVNSKILLKVLFWHNLFFRDLHFFMTLHQ